MAKADQLAELFEGIGMGMSRFESLVIGRLLGWTHDMCRTFEIK
jgi:hypothetical protein